MGVATVCVGIFYMGVVSIYKRVCDSQWPLVAEGCKYLNSGKLNHFGFSRTS